MSLTGTSTSDAGQFKKFESESEIEEKKQKRQEEWDKVRKADDPEEAPEEVYDPRSLYEQLEDQKQRKEDEYAEQFKLKNQVKGLDKDEAEFLDYVSHQQEEVENKRKKEDAEVLLEYKSAVSSMVTDTTSKPTDKKQGRPAPSSSSSKKSQLSLLAGAVKRKSCDQPVTEQKKMKETTETSSPEVTSSGQGDAKSEVKQERSRPQTAQIIGILPGLGAYDDSSDSDDTSSDSEIDTEILSTKKSIHKCMQQHDFHVV